MSFADFERQLADIRERAERLRSCAPRGPDPAAAGILLNTSEDTSEDTLVGLSLTAFVAGDDLPAFQANMSRLENEEYPGTGIGLAIVQKAMRRMHGRAWAEGAPGQGACFYLEIPK